MRTQADQLLPGLSGKCTQPIFSFMFGRWTRWPTLENSKTPVWTVSRRIALAGCAKHLSGVNAWIAARLSCFSAKLRGFGFARVRNPPPKTHVHPPKAKRGAGRD